jgi:hypothetical protein
MTHACPFNLAEGLGFSGNGSETEGDGQTWVFSRTNGRQFVESQDSGPAWVAGNCNHSPQHCSLIGQLSRYRRVHKAESEPVSLIPRPPNLDKRGKMTKRRMHLGSGPELKSTELDLCWAVGAGGLGHILALDRLP